MEDMSCQYLDSDSGINVLSFDIVPLHRYTAKHTQHHHGSSNGKSDDQATMIRSSDTGKIPLGSKTSQVGHATIQDGTGVYP